MDQADGTDKTDNFCDVVLEGGGVKGIALVGALDELIRAGYRPRRIGGTSAGAIVGSLLAAGMDPGTMTGIMRDIDYTKFRDETLWDKLGLAGETASLVFTKGLYRGEYARNWLKDQLAALGVVTFADLKLPNEPWVRALPPSRRYKLVIIVSDVTRGRLVRLPWDYERDYGLNPDDQLVADAVHASMAIPFFYEPVRLGGNFLVDGGLLSNFPVDIFDDTAAWPTFGIKLSAKANAVRPYNVVTNPVNYGMAILSTAMNAHDQMHVDNPCTQKRTVFVDTLGIKGTHFDITRAEQTQLFKNGQKYAQKFFKTWDFAEYQRSCAPHEH